MRQVGRSQWVYDGNPKLKIPVHERLQIAGVNLARANTRIRHLEKNADTAKCECGPVRSIQHDQLQLRIRNELQDKSTGKERDDYREKLRDANRIVEAMRVMDLEIGHRTDEATQEQLFLVWRQGGGVPCKVHHSHDSAMTEAKRLAKANPGKRFYVLYTIGNALAQEPEVEWVISDERFDDDGGIPF